MTLAFLRGINVGGHRVKMDHLTSLFEELGLKNVSTFIASGNVIFESRAKDIAALERKIEKHLNDALGYAVPTFIRTSEELAAVTIYRAFPDADAEEATINVLFLHAPLSGEVQEKVLALCSDLDTLHIHGREVYWLCRGKMSESKLFVRGLLEKTIGEVTTTRNLTTLNKLVANAISS
jgi:uncharacterized protein (DUF1697 family)